MDSYQITFETFNKQAQAYQDKFSKIDLYDDTYDMFCQLIEKPQAKILEIGCGPGNITKYISSKKPGCKILAIDAAPNMITLAKKNNPEVDCKVMDCRHIDKILGWYDGIVCGFCLPYMSASDFKKLLSDCLELLNTGGIFYLSAIEGDYENSGFETSSNGLDKAYVYYYREDYLTQELHKNKFDVLQVFRKDFGKPDGTSFIHLILIAKKQ